MKSKIHKIELYVVDVENEFNEAEDLIDYLDYRTDCFYKKAESKTVEFEWDDDLLINKIDVKLSDFEEYFNK